MRVNRHGMGATFLAATAPAVFLALGLVGAPSARAQGKTQPITIAVDLTQAPQKILHTHLEIPVQTGPVTLYYPQWIPGEHMPDGPIIQMAGLKFTGAGKPIAWRRDLVEMFAIHVDVPQGVPMLEVDFDFLLSGPSSGFSAGASATASLDVLSWNQVLLYPKGMAAKDVYFSPSLKLPAGWKFGTALPIAKQDGDSSWFDTVALTELVDSPVIAGRFYRAIQLTPSGPVSHEVDIAADSAAALEMSPDTQAQMHNLVTEAQTLFGTYHYRGYHFLLTLSDDVAHFGLEHHESSDDRTSERSLIDEGERIEFASLLPHEYVHSWNGKFRRPAGLSTPDYQQPMKDDLLWVYEGLTEYLGSVLTARSQLLSAGLAREDLALLVAHYENRPGRDWRPLQDTADAAPFLYDSTADWANWRRGTDFYEEGQLLWLDVDSTIRIITNDKKSIDDFCKIFHGGEPGKGELKTYTFEDVVTTLNQVAPNDWAAFLRARLDGVATKTPEEAITNSGWRLEYNEQPNTMLEVEEGGRGADLTFSLGLTIAGDGTVVDVIHDGPAYKAGIGPGMKIVAVNGAQYSSDSIHSAIDAAKSGTEPMQVITSNGARIETRAIDYHGGNRFPHIVRDETHPDYLSEIYHGKSAQSEQ
jgi:predicted metalloprotease with PDZ domain